MLKTVYYPVFLTAPVVSDYLKKYRKGQLKTKRNRGRNSSKKLIFFYYLKLVALFIIFGFCVYLGFLNWIGAMFFIVVCLILNAYYFKRLNFASSDEVLKHQANKKIINWQQVLVGKIIQPDGVASAPQGMSENFFAVYLQKYFAGIIYSGEPFSIPKSNLGLCYTSDFAMVLPDGLSTIIEIDEPYYYRDFTPTHCIDDQRDRHRNEFFLQGGWNVIRFAEEQIALYPEGCCFEIAKYIFRLTDDANYLEKFNDSVEPVKAVKCWTTEEALMMAGVKFRDWYLFRSGIKK